MYISKNSFIVNGINMGIYLQKVVYGFFDTWSSDSGFNTNSGDFTGVFKGTYPKFTLQFRPLKPEEITYLTNNLFRTGQQTVTYDDPSGVRKTIKTHKGDLQYEFSGINKSQAFAFELVGNKKL